MVQIFCRVFVLASVFVLAARSSASSGLFGSTTYYAGVKAGTYQVVSLGDSIASGYNPSNWFAKVPGGTYADKFGGRLSARTGYSVRVQNIARAGDKTGAIDSSIHRHADDLSAADYISITGGGNDLLTVGGNEQIDLCKYESYVTALDGMLANLSDALKFIAAKKKATAQVSVLGMYYPLVNRIKERKCLGAGESARSAHRTFLDIASAVNWTLRAGAKRFHFSFADVFAAFDCAGNAKCKIENYSSLLSYRNAILAADSSGILKDPSVFGVMQKDTIHPNDKGTDLILALFSR